MDAELTGPMRTPVLSGKMEVNDGRIRHFSLPHSLDQIAGVVTFDSKGINLDELSGTYRQRSGDLRRHDRNRRLSPRSCGRHDHRREHGAAVSGRRHPWLKATVDAGLSLEGTVEALTLRGDVTVHRAEYTKEFGAGVNLFDFGQRRGLRHPSSTFTTPTLPLSYDVRITASSTVTAQNTLLREVVASADVRLVGTFEKPGLRGNIDVDRGDVLFGGKRYQLRRAGIQFTNSSAIEPFFDIEAQTRVRVPGENLYRHRDGHRT